MILISFRGLEFAVFFKLLALFFFSLDPLRMFITLVFSFLHSLQQAKDVPLDSREITVPLVRPYKISFRVFLSTFKQLQVPHISRRRHLNHIGFFHVREENLGTGRKSTRITDAIRDGSQLAG